MPSALLPPASGPATPPGTPVTVRQACEEILTGLDRDGLMPSLYLERGGVLRCHGLRGYWQLLDGFRSGEGVIGQTFASGRPHVVEDVRVSQHYLEASPEVRAELCVPVRARGRVVGVLNVESARPLPPGLPEEVEGLARGLGDRIVALGGLPEATAEGRLVRAATRITGLVDAADIAAEVAAAACDLLGMSSALVATVDDDGVLGVRASAGPLTDAFSALGPGGLGRMAGWVTGVSSCYTFGDAEGRGFVGHEALREAGAQSLIVLPLATPARRRGIVVVADAAPRRLGTEQVELLELLAAQAASALRTAAAVEALTERAASDPLTGLGHAATFHSAVAEARAGLPRDDRLALLLADVDGFKQVNDTRGHRAGDELLCAIAEAIAHALRGHDPLFRVGGDEFAALLHVDTVDEALAVGRRVVEAVRALGAVTLSAGLAVAEPDEDDPALFTRADRALYEVKRAGRDGLRLASSASSIAAAS